MELKEFIAKTLTELIDGIKLSQDGLGDSGKYINPHFIRPPFIYAQVIGKVPRKKNRN